MKEENKKILEEVKSAIPNESGWNLLTGAIMFLFLGTILASMKNLIKIDLSTILFALTIVTGCYYFRQKKYWGQFLKENEKNETIKPWWLDWTADSFIMILVIFLFRAFIGEPFLVPTGSMIPTIMINDILLTSKMSYSIKIPVIDKEIYKAGNVKRGDIVVFKYPVDNSTYYVKRFVGVPGDEIEYNNFTKEFKINGKNISKVFDKDIMFQDPDTYNVRDFKQYKEDFFGIKHDIWVDEVNHSIPFDKNLSKDFIKKESCIHTLEKVSCKVPKGYYFAMGDDRDNSWDSRFWGFVPESNIVGKPIYLLSISRKSAEKLQ